MKYTVTYKRSAEQELAAICTKASNRSAVTEAANRVDVLLRGDPLGQGESRQQNIRIMFERPLAIEFEIKEADLQVEVLRVSWIGD